MNPNFKKFEKVYKKIQFNFVCDKIGLVMKNITKSALLISVLLSAGVVFSAETYKNSILDMSMKKELNNTVSLTFYTSKPYNENLFVTKRNANTYVILFPETNTDIKKEISRAETEGLIQKVDVKTQPYNDQNGKGYTKVVLTTPENTTVLAKTEVYNSEAQMKKTAETILPPAIKKPEQTETKTSAQEKQVQTQQKAEQKTASKNEQQQKFDIIKPENLPKADNNKVAALPDVIKKEEVQEEIVKNEPQQEEQANVTEGMPLQEADAEKLPAPPENVKKAQKSELVLFFESKAFWGSAAALLLLIFAVLYIQAKKKIKEIIGEDGVNVDPEKLKSQNYEAQEQPKQETADNEKDSKVNLYRLLNASEEGEPQETEDTYSDELASLLDVQNEENPVSENKGEEILSQTSDEDIVFDDMVLDETAEISEDMENMENDNIETEVVLDDIVIDNSEKEEHEDDLFELSQEKKEVHEESITPENSIDDYMKYLADNPEKLEVGNSGVYEEITDTVSENNYAENTEQEISISDMSDDEIKLAEDEQSRLQEVYDEFIPAEDETQNAEFADDEIKSAPAEFEQSDADSMFEREDFTNDIMQTSDEEEIQIQNNEQDYDEVPDNEPIFDNENNVLDLTDYKQTVKIHQPVIASDEEEITDNATVDYVEEHDDSDDNSVLLENGLKVVSQVQIKKNAGLYMVDYDGNHSLIGFKNDNYYVLKSFDEIPSKELQARLYDKTGQKEQYIVKLGKEKMIVEFNRKEIKHVMDL